MIEYTEIFRIIIQFNILPKKRGVLSGSVEEIAGVLAEYEALGAAHLMFHLRPSTPTAYERLADAVQLYRNNSAAVNSEP